MFGDTQAFSGYSVQNIEAARNFYGSMLGIHTVDQPGMGLELHFPNGHRVFLYEKADHKPADFTVLNFPVENIDAAVDELTQKGIRFEHYDTLPVAQDDKGVLRGQSAGYGPDIAWFKDPSGNILSILQN